MLFGWLQVGVVLAAAGMFVGKVSGWLVSRRWLRSLDEVEPAKRFVLLSLFALLPFVCALGAVVVAFTPSLLDSLGVVADHCAHHAGHAFHLCFLHGSPPDISPVMVGVSALVVAWPLFGLREELKRAYATRKWARELDKLSRFDEDLGARRLDSQRAVALTVGLFRPMPFVSEKLCDVLSQRQLRAVLAHEQAHARRLDALVKLIVRTAARMHFESVREPLIERLDIACEQACDQSAAEAIGDRLTVAETILAVERARGDEPSRPSALEFGGAPLQARVTAMVDDQWRAPLWWIGGAIIAGAAAGFGRYYDLLHHTVETMLAAIV
ncbi:MAG: M56 family metallopeptidase [Persicimonas sp.]